jgi:hypothetical protein
MPGEAFIRRETESLNARHRKFPWLGVGGASNRTFDGADMPAQLNESLSLSFPWDSFWKSCAGSAPLTLNLMKVKTNQFRGFLSLIGSA